MVLSPFAPHLAEELWERLGERFSGFEGRASTQRWPDYDEDLLALDEVEYGVQINGKVRDRILARTDASDTDLEKSALAAPKIREAIAGKSVLKLIIVRGKLINIVLAK
jgi:leucyl-tRNA synthetase